MFGNFHSYCLDSAKKISNEQTAAIMEKFIDMCKLMDEFTQRNSIMSGKLDERSSACEAMKTALPSAVKKMLEVTKRLETAARKAAPSRQLTGICMPRGLR